jgi:hypothetical protein
MLLDKHQDFATSLSKFAVGTPIAAAIEGADERLRHVTSLIIFVLLTAVELAVKSYLHTKADRLARRPQPPTAEQHKSGVRHHAPSNTQHRLRDDTGRFRAQTADAPDPPKAAAARTKRNGKDD